VTFIALVQGAGPNFPTGTVSFVSGSTLLGTAPLNANGLATLTFDPNVGTDAVVAQYPGDTLFAASNSTPAGVLVAPTIQYTMNITPAIVSLASGDHTTLQIDIVSAANFTDTLSIGCAGLPPSATCTFSTSSIAVSGGGSSKLSVVLDTGTPLGAGPTASLSPHGSAATLACILPGGALLALLLYRPRRFRKQLSLLMMLLAIGAIGMLSGCGNSLDVNNTPQGSYTFQIIGKGLVSGAVQSGIVSLTVTQ
jgi:hypothetical protein